MLFGKKNGLPDFIENKTKRIKILEKMLKEFNEGRSKSYYCIASALLSIEALESAFQETQREVKAMMTTEIKEKTKIMKKYLEEASKKEGVSLKLRKK